MKKTKKTSSSGSGKYTGAKVIPMRLSSRKRAPVPARTGRSAGQSRADAYERLGVDPTEVHKLPQITHILAKLSVGGRGSASGIEKAIEFLRGADNDDARNWLAVYDVLPESARKLLPFEAFCLAANITTKRMLEVVTGACFEQSASTSALLAAASHPDVVGATVRNAKHYDGVADRKMLHQHAGFLPQPKNQTTILGAGAVQNNTQITDNSKNLTIAASEVLPGVESKMARIANRFNTGLPEGAVTPVAVLPEHGEDNGASTNDEDDD